MTPDPMAIQRAQAACALVERRAEEYRRAEQARRLAHAQLQLAHQQLSAALEGLGAPPARRPHMADEVSHDLEA